MRQKLTFRVDRDLVQQAKSLGINMSRLTEQSIADSIGKRTYMHVQNDIVQIEMQSTGNKPDLENREDNETGWCVGRNPPSVLGDIHLIGIPAPWAVLTGAYYPFHSVCRHFTLTANLLNASASQSRMAEVFFCALTQPLGRHLTVPRDRHVDGVSSSPSRIGPGVARQLTNPMILTVLAVQKCFAFSCV